MLGIIFGMLGCFFILFGAVTIFVVFMDMWAMSLLSGTLFILGGGGLILIGVATLWEIQTNPAWQEW